MVSGPNQIIFIGLRSCKDYYKRPSGVAEVCGKGHLDVSFFTRGQCVLREWIVVGSGLYEFFGEQVLKELRMSRMEQLSNSFYYSLLLTP